MFDTDQYSIGNDADTAEMFGDLVKQNIERGADPDTVGEWARYAFRYAEKAYERKERNQRSESVIDDCTCPTGNHLITPTVDERCPTHGVSAAHRAELRAQVTADVLGWYQR